MLEQGTAQGHRFNTVLQCSSNAGIVAGVEAGLGVSILNRRHVTRAMEVIEAEFVTPPDIAYIVRVASKTNANAVKALAGEIVRETGELPQLRVAG